MIEGERRRGVKVLIFLSLSVLLHLSLFVFLVLTSLNPASPSNEDWYAQKEESLEIENITESDFEERLKKALAKDDKKIQIVQTDDRLAVKDAPDETAYLTKSNQWAKENTRAAQVGAFQNDPGDGSSKEKKKLKVIKDLFSLPPSKLDQDQELAMLNKTGITRSPSSLTPPNNLMDKQIEKELNNDISSGEGGPMAATDDYLNDIAIGAQTILNAKEYKFYSFYERIRMNLNERWQSILQNELHSLYVSGNMIQEGDKITQVLIQLKEDGSLHKIKLLGSSGYKELDRAATSAFALAAPFPNPPHQMIDPSTKLVDVRWDFVVSSSGGRRIRFDVNGTGR